MPTHSTTTIAGQLHIARLAISNTRTDDELKVRVARFGYTDAKLDEGQRLYDAAVAAVSAQASAAAAQYLASAEARAAEQRARESYQALAQVARAVLQTNPAQRAALGLVGNAPQSISAFLSTAETLFQNALTVPIIRDNLRNYGYDAARLGQEQAAIRAFDQAYRARVAAMGAAQQATRDQSAALAALRRWHAQYMKIAKVALHDKPKLIEKLGKVARSAKTAGQRGAPQKAAATRAARKAQLLTTDAAATGD